MVDQLPNQAKNGRGAVGNPAGRFERTARAAIDDGWLHELMQEEDDAPKLKTNLHIDTSRTVINPIDSPDLPYMRSINPYRGCEHGCIYCYARPSHSYLGFSSGLDFETEIFYKPDAPEILLRELAVKNYEPYPLTLGSNTDCYQPVERELNLTRRIVEILHAHDHPLTIITKSALVARDLDLLAPMAAKGLARVLVSVTTLDGKLARVMEPRAAAPHRRLATIRALAEAGVPVTVMVAPLIPGLTDMEIEKILAAAYDAGAREAHYTVVRLAYDLKELFQEWLTTHRPERKDHVLSLIRQMRGGKLYDSAFGQRRSGTGPLADLIADRFALACKRLGFNKRDYDLRTDLFRPPARNGQFAFTF
ncbi:MAG: PA0069 family radical SAM protein [Alphaproteobacteria bacterium]|nr:PA0069 family radical SAM protein [Alphaproteobacteria bacterium]